MTKQRSCAATKAASIHTMLHMLAYKRPSGSKTERKFIRQFILPLGVWMDRAGNLYKRIPQSSGACSNVLWSCHTDTVHNAGGTQLVEAVGDTAILPNTSKSNCLGADDTAGVWLMCELIKARKPGLYIFHRAEEIGLVGSSYIADHTPELLQGIEIAIALDRKGTKDVITFQQGARCASEAFADSLSSGLGMDYHPSPDGVYTDTASYMGLVPECTNISVGYFAQHSRKEVQDLGHLDNLREALLALDLSKLEVARDPSVIDYASYGDDGSAYGGGGGWTDMFGDHDQGSNSHRDHNSLCPDAW
jgi:hypothetical protein